MVSSLPTKVSKNHTSKPQVAETDSRLQRYKPETYTIPEKTHNNIGWKDTSLIQTGRHWERLYVLRASQTCRAQLERDGIRNQAISDEMTQSTLDFPSAKETGPGLD